MKTITLPKPKKTLFCAIGILLMPITLLFFYSNFFERENYLNRKSLYKHLIDNPLILDRYKIIIKSATWEFRGFTLHLWSKNDWSLHYDSKCVICRFRAGVQDIYYYHKIKKMLIEATGKNKPVVVI